MMQRPASGSRSRPLRIEFDRIKYGRELLVDAALIRHMPTFIDDVSPHILTFHDILLVTRGRGEIFLDGESHAVMPGVVIFCLPGQVREWRLSTPLDGACLFFAKEFVADTFSDSRFLDHFAFFRLPRPNATLTLDTRERRLFRTRFATMQRELANFQTDADHALRAALYAILVLLNRWYVARNGNLPTSAPDKFVERFRSLVERDFARRHRVADYARELGVTPGHLNVLCRTQMHFGASSLIRSRILLEARRLLLYGNLSAAQIADRLGFDDPAYFTRFFRREAGMVPMRFRQSLGT